MFQRRPNYHQRSFNGNPYFSQQSPYWDHPHQPTPRPPYKPTAFQYYAKPKQPANWHTFSPPNTFHYGPNEQQVSNGFLNYFQDKDGQMDFDKMFSTVGQIANTFQQVSPMVKQFGSIMKNFK